MGPTSWIRIQIQCIWMHNNDCMLKIYFFKTCCGSGMIYARSWSGNKFLELWIRIPPMFFKPIWKLLQKSPYNRAKRRIYPLTAFFISHYSTVPVQSRIHRPALTFLPDPEHMTGSECRSTTLFKRLL